MNPKLDRRVATAYHEAGHVLLALLIRARIQFATIHPKLTDSPWWRDESGPLATDDPWKSHDRDDVRGLLELLKVSSGGPDASLVKLTPVFTNILGRVVRKRSAIIERKRDSFYYTVLQREIAVSMAGRIAARCLAAYDGASQSDEARIDTLLSMLSSEPSVQEASRRMIEVAVESICLRNVALLNAIAEALLRDTTLTGSEIGSIVRNAGALQKIERARLHQIAYILPPS